MVGRATRLVLYFGWPCALALVVAVAGVRLDADSAADGRRPSTVMYAKYEALSVCVQSVTGEQQEAEKARDLMASSLAGLGFASAQNLTGPPVVDVGCPRAPAHFGSNAKAQRVARRVGDDRPTPSPYHLHVFLMPRTTLQMLSLEPDLANRRAVVEEYAVTGSDANAVMRCVTYGLYATPEELRDVADARRFFQQLLQSQSQLGALPRVGG